MNAISKTGFLVVFTVSAISFGMDRCSQLAKANGWHSRPHNLKNVTTDNSKMSMNKDLLIKIAAFGDGEVKNNMSKTSKNLNTIIRKSNPCFVGLPEFTAHEKDINTIVLFFSWHKQHPEIIKSLSKKMATPGIISFGTGNRSWSIGSYGCEWPRQFELDYPGKLNTQYVENNAAIDFNTNNLPSQAEKGLLCAALCKDEKSVEMLAQKIKSTYSQFPIDIKIELHNDLLLKLFAVDDPHAFKLIVRHDPYSALNLYSPNDKTGDYDKPFLNYLDGYVGNMPQEKRNIYKEIYRDCGGKTIEELQPQERCIIS